MKIILTGATGLIGSRFEELMVESHEIIPLSSKEVMIQNADSVRSFLEDHEAEVVVHLAAKTDVDACEADKEEDLHLIEQNMGENGILEFEKIVWKPEDWLDKSSAFSINFIGTRNLYEEAKQRGIKFVYVSTDFVFAGNGTYDEESETDPVNWYGKTKWYGEKLIDTSKDLIVRLSFPYGYPSPVKPDFVQKLIGLLRDKDEVSLIEDQTITPTFIDDIVFGLDFLIKKNAIGIYHLTGSSHEDPYNMGQKINRTYGFTSHINRTARDKIYAGKAKRPFQSIMNNEKIAELGFRTKTFDEGLALISSK